MQLKMDKSDVLTNDCYSEVARIVGQEGVDAGLDAIAAGLDVIDAITGVMDDDDDEIQSLESEDDSGSEELPQLVPPTPRDDNNQSIPKRDILGAPRNTEALQGTPDTALLPEGGLDQQRSTEQDDPIQFIEVEFT